MNLFKQVGLIQRLQSSDISRHVGTVRNDTFLCYIGSNLKILENFADQVVHHLIPSSVHIKGMKVSEFHFQFFSL